MTGEPARERADGEDLTELLDRYFTRCRMCGTIHFWFWEIHRPRFRLRLCQWRRRCRREQVTQERVRSITGKSERDLLRLMYSYLGSSPAKDAERAARAEVERRLGMSPVHPVDVAFAKVKTDSVTEALRVLAEEALPAIPVIDLARVEAEHEPLTRGFEMGPLWSGPPEEAMAVLRTSLEHEQSRPDFHCFLIEVEPDQFRVELDSVSGDPVRAFGKLVWEFAGYRVWRGADRVFLCGHKGSRLGSSSVVE